MERPPRAVDRPLVTRFGIWRILFVGALLVLFTLLIFFRMKAQGASDAMARTAAVVVLQLLFTYAPPLQAVFDTESLPLPAWGLVGGTVVFFFLVEAEKLVVRSVPRLREAAVVVGRNPEEGETTRRRMAIELSRTRQ